MTAMESSRISISFEKVKKDKTLEYLVIGSIILCLMMICTILKWWI